MNYYGNECVESDPSIALSKKWMRPTGEMGIVGNRSTEATRGAHSSKWPLTLALKRGYAVATFYYGDVEPDFKDGWQQGVRGYLRRQSGRSEPADDDWGAIGAWAWGLSRAVDYLQTDANIAPQKIAVFGHSRQGKAALWAGAQDERIALTISNDSGQGGASLAKRRFGETVAASVDLSGYWYCNNYRQFANNESALPIDQHMLIALIAPRPVYVASATEDLWADPRGEFLAALHAEPVYQLLGAAGLGVNEMPPVDSPVGETIGYHVRTGDHDITAVDWKHFLDFADKHFQ
jgi:hypothetical protein